MESNNERKIFLRLANFNPNFKDKFGNQILDYLVLDALSSAGSIITQTIREISTYIKNTYKIDFHDFEIIASGKRLAQNGIIELVEDTEDDYPILKIKPAIEQKIATNITKTVEIENQVFDEWKDELTTKYNGHPDVVNNLEKLVYLLKVFISKLLRRHGIECITLLYPKSKKTSSWFDNLSKDIFDEIIDNNEFLNSVFQIEIPSFFRSDNKIRRHYVISLLNSRNF